MTAPRDSVVSRPDPVPWWLPLDFRRLGGGGRWRGGRILPANPVQRPLFRRRRISSGQPSFPVKRSVRPTMIR
ncbi:unnamed protein product [Cuscuta campestris]|uniref:Uncharacterized protein n=1 Tax=Cuscuta campestris TaxID=132261 RepID=A0A484LSH6_9ASTE|nr:unnamed protein product [Cuscuta campestris]